MNNYLKNSKTSIKSKFEPEKLELEYKIDEGYQACKSGSEFWENPYSEGYQNGRYFQEWLFGWCRAKQKQENNGEV